MEGKAAQPARPVAPSGRGSSGLRRRAPLQCLVAFALAAFLLWRTAAALRYLPGLVRSEGWAQGLGWSAEQRLGQGLAGAFKDDPGFAPEAGAVLQLLRRHTGEHDVVLLLAEPENANMLRFVLATTAFPRVFVRTDSPAKLAELAARVRSVTHATLYLLAAEGLAGDLGPAEPALATTEGHALWRLPEAPR